MVLESSAAITRTVGRLLDRFLDRFQELVGPGTLRTLLALGDQAMVSGSRFTATVIIGRTCGAGELGAYGLCFTFVVLFLSILQSLVVLPYTVYWKRRKGRRSERHAGSALLHLFSLALLASVSMVGASAISSRVAGGARIREVFLALSVFLPGLMLWEFSRKIAFAHLRVRTVFLLDFCAATLFILSLVFLAVGGSLSAVTAYMVMGTLFGATALICLANYGLVFRPDRQRALLEAVRSWRFGRWILASETLFLARGYSVTWLVAFFLGTEMAGVFVAYFTIVALANPLLHGISNVLAPDLARAQSEKGIHEVRRLVFKASLALGGTTLALSLFLSVLGESIVRALYGPEFFGYPVCAAILAFGFFAEAVGLAAYNALWAVERSNACFVACVGAIVVTVLATVSLTPLCGLAGAAAGVLSGRAAGTVIQLLAFRRYVHMTTTEGAVA